MSSEGGGLWRCLTCQPVRKKMDLKRHIVAKHLYTAPVNCSSCGKQFKNSDSLRHHSTKCGDGYQWLAPSSWLSIITVNIDTRNHKMQSFGVPAHLIITHTTKDANEREQKYLGNSQDAIACVIPWEILISKGQDTKYVYKIGPRFTFAVIQIMFVYFGAYPTQGKYVDDKDHCGE